MIDNLIAYSVKNKFVIGIFIVGLITWGLYSLKNLPLDAVPDITNNQVQVITSSPNLATLEVEQFITTPIELALQNLPDVVEVRSISRFGLSVVTIVFEESMGTYLPRQLVNEKLKEAEENIPEGLGSPSLAPISTGLGEIYQYVVRAKDGYEDKISPTQLRSAQDWIIKRQLAGIPGVVEVNTLGGLLKEYEVAINPERLRGMNISLPELIEALEASNENTGGAYIEKTPYTYFIRSEGMVKSLEDIEKIVVKVRNGVPILVKDIANVQWGAAPRYGATTMDGKGEVVGGLVMMLKGENSAAVTTAVEKRITKIQKSLPEGIEIEPFLVRNDLVNRTISTVKTNLIEGGLIVIFILVLLLGNFRAGLIVASVIPLAMLFAVSMMRTFGISANLMSLGAIDFGLIVDGAVIIVESIVHRLHSGRAGQQLSTDEMNQEVITSSIRIRKSAAFGEIIILMVYIPILALTGIEGKMFGPMAMTVGFAIVGALILSLTYVPMMSALFLNKNIVNKVSIADKIMNLFQRIYSPLIHGALKAKSFIVAIVFFLFLASLFTFSRMGGEFIPTLEEGDLALHQILPPGSSLEQSIEVSGLIQEKLLNNFPEVEKVVTKIGAAEVPTDPMSIETGDIMVIMKPKEEWTSASTKQGMFKKMEKVLLDIPGINYEFTQPIQMRFNELMTGSRADIALKIYGDDLDVLFNKAKEAEQLIQQVGGIQSTKVEQIAGMPQVIIRYHYAKLAEYGLHIREVNRMIRTAFAGEYINTVYEGDRRFDLVVRMDKQHRQNIDDINNLYIPLNNGQQVPLSAVAQVSLEEAPMQISRDNAQRRIVVGINAGDKDVQTLVEDIQATLDANFKLPPGYYISYGGQFENLVKATNRLLIAVPLALAIIFILLYFTFGSISQAILIFTAIPLSAIGGIWALWLRGMPFSISAGIGFIALFGVAVLNGIVLIAYFNQLKEEGMSDIHSRILEGTKVRLRPVIMTAAVASLGFLPMAISSSGGAEVQRPLATVVIGGLITATVLTLIVLPILYSWLEKWNTTKTSTSITPIIILFFVLPLGLTAQSPVLTLDNAITLAIDNYPSIKAANLQIEQQQQLQQTGFVLAPTSFSFELNSYGKSEDLVERNIGISQSFQLPKVYQATNQLQAAKLGVLVQQKELTTLQLQAAISQLYNNGLLLQEQIAMLQHFDSLYQHFVNIASLRVETGEAASLEKIAAENSHAQIQLNQQQLMEQLITNKQLLSYYTGQTDDFRFEEAPNKLAHTEFNIDNHPILGYFQEMNTVAAAQVNVAKSQLLPSFNIGYANQKLGGVDGLHNIQLGVNIPLFQKNRRQQIEATKMQQAIIGTKAEEAKLKLQQQQSVLMQQLQQYTIALSFYEQQGSVYSKELVRTATLNYNQGEISYIAYVQALQQAFDIEMNYIQNLQGYNATVLQMKYLY